MNEPMIWKDISMAFVLERAEEYGMEFSVVYVKGFGVPDGEVWWVHGSEENILENAETVFSGYIKWDGCANLDFGNLHICGYDGAKDLGKALHRVYELASQYIPTWDEETAGYPPLQK